MLQMCLRTAVLYFTVVLCLRLMGKRQVGELEPSELAVTFLVSEIATIPLQNPEVPLLYGIVPVALLMALEVGLSILILKIVPLRELLCGRASRLMRRGHIDQRELRRQRMSVEELMGELRVLGYPDIGDLEEVVLESGGKISAIPKKGRGSEKSGPCTVLINGRWVDKKGLEEAGMTRSELLSRVRAMGYSRISDILYMYRDAAGRIHTVPYEKNRGSR